MAEVLTTNKTGRKGGLALSTKVDLTPMVDLGFILIIFFIFTTTLSEPKALNLNITAGDDSTMVAESKTLNLVLGADNKIHFFVGNELSNPGCTNFSTGGVRKVITDMQHAIRKQFGSATELVILIRPTTESSYMNLVDILDEMMILNVKKYSLMDEPSEIMLSSLTGKSHC